jgi:hypothetical protein
MMFADMLHLLFPGPFDGMGNMMSSGKGWEACSKSSWLQLEQ